MEFISQPWAWYVAGPAIAFVLFLMFYFGRSFGVSTNLETFCTLGGAGRFSDYFKIDWKARKWSLIFVVGIILGGLISSQYLMPSQAIDLNPETVQDLAELGFANAGKEYLPAEIFSTENLLSIKGIGILLVAGLFIGFGTRYAGGCTSGHAITGLSNLQLPSLVAVIGFFAGGLLMIWVLFPFIF
ncbi:MAG: YeeE/YedE family protein [Flavobacteriaceae bacterium]|nr:YeeE/YedE family protein [Flavobacteriaceae bacterium]